VDVPRTLLVTNDYPPRIGGIQRTLESLVDAWPAGRVSVLAPAWQGDAAFDRSRAYRVLRQPEPFLWPTRAVARRIRDAVDETRSEVVLFGATYPLALTGPSLAAAGIPYVAAAHGFEYWLSLAPGTNALMRRATGRAARVVVLCSRFVGRRVRTAVPSRVPVSVLLPGADLERFRPGLDAGPLRDRLGIGEGPVVSCVSRLVPRKGQDVLIRSIGEVRRRAPGATLAIVGGGPYAATLRRLAAEVAPPGSVRFAGQVREADLPLAYAVGDVFAMPCRDRLGGLEVEGWGNVFLEAAACGLPVVVGRSGGAPETVVDGATGLLVDGRDVGAVAGAVGDLLADPDRARAMGAAGRARAERDHAWPAIAERLAGWLREAVEGRSPRSGSGVRSDR